MPNELRGTYAGLAHPAAIAHFKALGVTTLELLPVQYHLDEPGLHDKGLVNYWGYNTLGFFCPDPRYRRLRPQRPDAQWPKSSARWWPRCTSTASRSSSTWSTTTRPRAARQGPTLSMRGLDNAAWYRLAGDDSSRSEN